MGPAMRAIGSIYSVFLFAAVALLACQASEQVPALVEELEPENSLFAQQTEMYDALVQEQDDPIFGGDDNSNEGHNDIVTDEAGIVDNDDDSFLHHHTGDGFPQGGYPSEASAEGAGSRPKEDEIGTAEYRDPVLHDDHLTRPVYENVNDRQDPIIADSHHGRVDTPYTPSPPPPLSDEIGGSEGDYSAHAIAAMDHLDRTMSANQTSTVE